MAFSFLQDNGGLTGSSDVSDNPDTSNDFSFTNALENIGVNFAAGAADVGVGALANRASVSPAQLYSGSSLFGGFSGRPGSISPLTRYTGVSSNLIVLGGLFIVGLIAYKMFVK